jgi:hypothetical protein
VSEIRVQKNVQKKDKKMLTSARDSGKLVPHTVKTEHNNTTHKMKTNKLLLTAAALLAAGIVSSQAQGTVYSANVVGYVNQVLPAGVYSMIGNPLSNGLNQASQVLPALQGGETMFIWNGTGYYVYQFQGTGVGTGLGYQSDWTDGSANHNIPGDQYDSVDQVYWAPQPVLAPGTGCFLLNPNGNETNTFVGTVISTNNYTLNNGVYNLLSSWIPVGGNVQTNSAINLTANFAGGETMFTWNGTGYYIYQFQGAGVGIGLGYQSDWTDGSATHNIPGDQYDSVDQVYWAPTPQLNVGQGFFILNPNANENWIQNVNLQSN